MPIFNFRNTETGEEFEDFLSNARREELLEKNPHIKQMPSSFAIVSTHGSTIDSKTDDGWKEMQSRIAEAHPDSPFADRYGNRSIKDIKTKAVIDKHRHKWRSQ